MIKDIGNGALRQINHLDKIISHSKQRSNDRSQLLNQTLDQILPSSLQSSPDNQKLTQFNYQSVGNDVQQFSRASTYQKQDFHLPNLDKLNLDAQFIKYTRHNEINRSLNSTLLAVNEETPQNAMQSTFKSFQMTSGMLMDPKRKLNQSEIRQNNLRLLANNELNTIESSNLASKISKISNLSIKMKRITESKVHLNEIQSKSLFRKDVSNTIANTKLPSLTAINESTNYQASGNMTFSFQNVSSTNQSKQPIDFISKIDKTISQLNFDSMKQSMSSLNYTSLDTRRLKQKQNLQLQDQIKQLEQKIKQKKTLIQKQSNANTQIQSKIEEANQIKNSLVIKLTNFQKTMDSNQTLNISTIKNLHQKSTTSQLINNDGGDRSSRLHSMYQNIIHGELDREKGLMQNSVQNAKKESQKQQSQLQALRDENKNLHQQLKRYKEMADSKNINKLKDGFVNKSNNDAMSVYSGGDALSLLHGGFNELRHQRNAQNTNTLSSSLALSTSSNLNNKVSLAKRVAKSLNRQINPHIVDIIKFEKFTTFLQNMMKIDKMFDYVLQFLDEVKNVFDCQKATLFVFSNKIYKEFFKDVRQEKHKYLNSIEFWDSQSLDKTKVLAISRSQKDLCESLIFTSILDLSKESLRKPSQMAVCMKYHKKDGELSCILQIEYGGESSRDKRMQSVTKTNKKAMKFSLSDEKTLRIFTTFLQLRFEKHLLIKEAKGKIQERQDAIQMANRICKMKTYKTLMTAIKNELKWFLNFGECGVLFYDSEKKKLFTLSMEDNDNETSENKQENDIKDIMLNEKSIIWFPSQIGITGHVFSNRIVYQTNNPKKYGQEENGSHHDKSSHHPKIEFMNEIDNSIGVKVLKNYMIGPLVDTYYHEGNGILQLFNFPMPITSAQVNRMKALSGFLGGCLSNIHEINRSMNTMVGIQMVMDECQSVIKYAERSIESNLAEYRNIFVPLDAAKKMCDYMDNFHVSNMSF